MNSGKHLEVTVKNLRMFNDRCTSVKKQDQKENALILSGNGNIYPAYSSWEINNE